MSLFDLAQTAAGLYGGYQERKAAQEEARATQFAAQQAADAATFKPFGVTTGFGTSFFDTDRGTAGYELDPMLAAYRDEMFKLGGAALPGIESFDPAAASQQYYNEMQAMMAPQRAQERTQMQQDIFGSGRLGMRLAGEAAGAGVGGGMYQPDVLGYNKAQELANQQLAMAARDKAMGDLDAAIARSSGLMATGFGTEKLGQEAMTLGADMGQAALTGAGAAAESLLEGGMAAAQANTRARQVYPEALAGLLTS